MSADLSLSQSLGGLRIANPDSDPVGSSPTSSPPAQRTSSRADVQPPTPSSPSSQGTLTDARRPELRPFDSYNSSNYESSSSYDKRDPAPYSKQAYGTSGSTSPGGRPPVSPTVDSGADSSRRGLTHRASMPMAQQAASAAAAAMYQSQQATYNPPSRHPSVQHRPVSGLHSQYTSATSTYRYGGEVNTADGSLGGLTRTGSRRTRQTSNASVTQLQGAAPPRTYRQPSSTANGGGGGGGAIGGGSGYPVRRVSQRARATTNASSSSAGQDHAEAGFGSVAESLPHSAEEWQERGAATRTVRETDASGQTHTRVVKKGVKDFHFGRTLGEGSYSTVLAATDRQNNKEYAIKVLDKRHIIKEKKVKYVNIERDTLNRLTEHPGIVRLYYTFQDERSLYFVLDLASGGELLSALKRLGSFDVECTRFYAAEILDSIGYMHKRDIIHRDLKPENVLLDRDMHVKITDFGTAKILRDLRTGSTTADGSDSDRAVSFVGTAEYVSPELLRDKNACKASDLWAFGCIVYQLLAGRPPFKAGNEYLTFQKILALDYTFPDGFPSAARDLIERLLVLEPTSRLPIEHIMSHRFFDGVSWGKGLWRQKPPRLKAYVAAPSEPIRLGRPADAAAASNAAHIAMTSPTSASASTAQGPPPPRRPPLHGVTELPPPSQLDIDWSPVLTHNNERILRLGNLLVSSGPAPPPSPRTAEDSASVVTAEKEKTKFAKFFSGATSAGAHKRRERLVLITSRARLVVAPAGGNEKKVKMEINLAATGATCRTGMDAKGLTFFSVDMRDKSYTFEDPRATTADPAGSKYSTQEWLDAIEQAREVAAATEGLNASFASSSNSPADSDTAMPLPSPLLGEGGGGGGRHMLRHTLRRGNTEEDQFDEHGGSGGGGGGVGFGGKKRFSKRHSKSGLAAVF